MGDGFRLHVFAPYFQLHILLGAVDVNAHDGHGFFGELGIGGAGDDSDFPVSTIDLIAQICWTISIDQKSEYFKALLTFKSLMFLGAAEPHFTRADSEVEAKLPQ